MPRPRIDSTEAFEKALRAAAESGSASSQAGEKYVLRLYVSGSTPRSARAVQNIRKLCEQHLPGRYDLEVIDIYQQPELAKNADLVAAPTLIKQLPIPLRKFVGDLSNTEKVLLGLDISTSVTRQDDPPGPSQGGKA